MINNLSNILTMTGLYVFLFIKSWFAAETNLQLILTTCLLIILLLLNIPLIAHKISLEMQDIMKFIGHIIFISLCISLGSWIVSLVYGSLFYFGFVNTIVGINIIGMLS